MRYSEIINENVNKDKVFTDGMLSGKMFGMVIEDVKFTDFLGARRVNPVSCIYKIEFKINYVDLAAHMTYDFDHMKSPRAFQCSLIRVKPEGVQEDYWDIEIKHNIPPRIESRNDPITELKTFLRKLKTEMHDMLEDRNMLNFRQEDRHASV